MEDQLVELKRHRSVERQQWREQARTALAHAVAAATKAANAAAQRYLKQVGTILGFYALGNHSEPRVDKGRSRKIILILVVFLLLGGIGSWGAGIHTPPPVSGQ